jgi:hypothetical protein
MMLRRVLACVLLAGLAACGAPALPKSGPVAVYEPTGEGGDSALLEGRLTQRDGCVVIESSGPTTISVPLFPRRATWSDEGLSFSGRHYPSGAQVAVGGGYSGRPLATSDARYVPAACGDLDVFVVHQDTTSLVD